MTTHRLSRRRWSTAGARHPEPASDIEPISEPEVREVIDPLAVSVDALTGPRADFRRHVRTLASSPDHPSRFIVGVAGGVAAGKSAIADALAVRLSALGHEAVAVSTDGFLWPNTELDRRGLSLRKGYPESYDHEGLAAFVHTARTTPGPLTAPSYSHELYDVAGTVELGEPTIVILEGVNALQGPEPSGPAPGPRELLDLGIFVDAELAHLEAWYVDRFVELCAAADEGSFYAAWSGQTEHEVRTSARSVWDAVNAANVTDHIVPTRSAADIVLHKGADHAVTHVTVRLR